jgi:hypothetical protein
MKGTAMNRLCVALVLAFLSSLTLAQQTMQPGRWEMTTAMKMQGMDLPGNKLTHCYTAKDLDAGKQYQPDAASKCTIANLKTAGGNISYDISCAIEGGKMTGTVKGTMAPATFSFDQKMRMTPDQGMGEMHSIIKGRRIGDCK